MATRQRMRRWLGTWTGLALAAIWTLGSGPVGAATVTFGYNGTLTYVNGSIPEFGGLPFGVGDPISGTFTFDPDAAPSWSTTYAASYNSALKSATTMLGPITITQDFVQTTASCSPAPDCTLPSSVYYEASMRVHAANPYDYSGQYFSAEAFALYPDLSPFMTFGVYLDGGPGIPGYTPPLITSTDLPEVPWDPSLFDQASGDVSTESFSVQFSLDEMYLVTVPEASVAALLAMALVGTRWLRHGRRA